MKFLYIEIFFQFFISNYINLGMFKTLINIIHILLQSLNFLMSDFMKLCIFQNSNYNFG